MEGLVDKIIKAFGGNPREIQFVEEDLQTEVPKGQIRILFWKNLIQAIYTPVATYSLIAGTLNVSPEKIREYDPNPKQDNGCIKAQFRYDLI